MPAFVEGTGFAEEKEREVMIGRLSLVGLCVIVDKGYVQRKNGEGGWEGNT